MKPVNQPVDVITICDKKGKITPIKFRLTDTDGESIVYNVKIITRDIEQQRKDMTILKFNCRFIENNITRQCVLHYFVHDTQWYLYRLY